MALGVSSSLWDLAGNLIQHTYGRIVQIRPNPTGSVTPYLYDGDGIQITGIQMQEAFERDASGDLMPTTGAFYDTFWTEDENGDKTPRDIKFWLDSDFNLIPIPNS